MVVALRKSSEEKPVSCPGEAPCDSVSEAEIRAVARLQIRNPCQPMRMLRIKN